MTFPATNVSPFHNDVLNETLLGRLCGQKQLFRDRYLVLRMLGRGGFGVTFLARDLRLPGKPLCVIKQLCPRVSELPALETARKRFQREAKTLAALGSHSQIPHLLDYFTVAEEFYLVQEYIRGMTIARLVRRYGCQSEVMVRRWLRELLILLQYIHANGVIHRDIKPQNIIRAQADGRFVLIDFGAVKEQLLPSGQFSSRNITTHFVGTVGFAPPEQFTLRPVYASDIYALGVTCLYLLTGKAPLEFSSDRKTGELQWRDRVTVSPSFARVLTKMLKPSLRDRYQSVLPILQNLDRSFERHDRNLSQCMNLQSPGQGQATDKSGDSPERLSSIAKTARAIRAWNAHRAKKQQSKPSQRGFHPSGSLF